MFCCSSLLLAQDINSKFDRNTQSFNANQYNSENAQKWMDQLDEHFSFPLEKKHYNLLNLLVSGFDEFSLNRFDNLPLLDLNSITYPEKDTLKVKLNLLNCSLVPSINFCSVAINQKSILHCLNNGKLEDSASTINLNITLTIRQYKETDSNQHKKINYTIDFKLNSGLEKLLDMYVFFMNRKDIPVFKKVTLSFAPSQDSQALFIHGDYESFAKTCKPVRTFSRGLVEKSLENFIYHLGSLKTL
jgi:hypothetical protein